MVANGFFVVGRRLCIGKSLGQLAVFLYLTALLQEFSFEIPKELAPPSLKTIPGQSRSPVPYFVRIIPRDDNLEKRIDSMQHTSDKHFDEIHE